MSNQVIPMLALERCEIYAAQICALIHLEKAESEKSTVSENEQEILRLVRNLNKDIMTIKSVVG